jgi:hypothetical protein
MPLLIVQFPLKISSLFQKFFSASSSSTLRPWTTHFSPTIWNPLMTAAPKMAPLPKKVESPAHRAREGTERLEREEAEAKTYFLPRVWTPWMTEVRKMRPDPSRVERPRQRNRLGRDKLRREKMKGN